METLAILHTVEDLDAGWLASVLGRPGLEILDTKRIGTGQMSLSFRVRFRDDDGEDSVVVKLAATDPASRATGVGMGAYFREVNFYANHAERIGGPLAHHHFAAYDPADGWFTLVLEDVRDGVQGDQIAGCGPEEARIALRALARIQAPVLGDPSVGAAPEFNQPNPLNTALLTALLDPFLERYADRIAPEHAEVCRRFVPVVDLWAEDRRNPMGLVHGDYRLDNMLFHEDGCTAVDWQTVAWGSAMLDAAYFVGGGLSAEDRQAHERELFDLYVDELQANGVAGLNRDACWDEYRRGTFHGILMTVAASMVVERTERGDEMFMTWLERNAQQVLDLDALDLLPDPDAEPPEALRPDPADEGRHEPGAEPLWNESWYFDAVSDDGSVGVYARLGRLPNQDASMVNVVVTGPGRPSVVFADQAAPLPDADDDAQRIDADGLRYEQHFEEALQRVRLVASGTAGSHADHAGPLRGESGEPVAFAIELTWETDGVPYQWRTATRYEMPCRVTGTVRVGDEEIAFSGPGQRDHSWGSRDWWAVDWMWSALHLDDGTRTHVVGVPTVPGYGVGYVQREGEVTEVTKATMTEELGEDGLIRDPAITSSPPELEVSLEPLGFGNLLLNAPDGRVAHFHRAMCRVTAADGRTGTGWVEWNKVQRPEE